MITKNFMRRARMVALAAVVAAAAVAVLAGGVPGSLRSADAQSEAPASPPSNRNGFLGVMLQDLDRGLRDSYDYTGTGAVVTAVIDGSPAEKIGLREGDGGALGRGVVRGDEIFARSDRRAGAQ